MVTTEMVSSADDIARGFLSGGGLAAGLGATSSKSLKTKNESNTFPQYKLVSMMD